jgi:hypothetical protein
MMAKRVSLEPCRKDCKAQKASDIVPPMLSGRHTGRMFLLLIAIAVCALGSPKRQVQPDPSLGQASLQFGQSLALSDFDRDGTTDRARLGAAGLRKSVEIIRFAPGAESITAPDESSQETADASTGCTLDQIPHGGCSALRGSSVLVSHQSPVSISSGDRCHPSQRGPPLLLS